MLRASDLAAALQGGLTGAEQRARTSSLYLLPMLLLLQPGIPLAFWTVRTLPGHNELLVLPKAALNPFSTQAEFVFGIAQTQVSDLTLGLVELHDVHRGPTPKVPLGWHPFPPVLYCTTQLGVISKLAEGTLGPTVHVPSRKAEQ